MSSIAGRRWRSRCRCAKLETHEAAHPDVFAGRGREPGHELADRPRRVTDVGLAEQLVDVLRIHRRDLHRDLLRELAELGIARDEVRLARELDERADPSPGVNVGLDDAFLRQPVGLLLRPCESALPQERLGLLEVPARLLERALAVHHTRAAVLAEALDILGIDRHHSSTFLTAVTSVSSAGSS